MSEEHQVIYYSAAGGGGAENWGEGEDELQALMHAAADSDARDTEEALLKQERETTTTTTTTTMTNVEVATTSDRRSGTKRRIEETDDRDDGDGGEGHSTVVAAHYNTLKERGLDERLKSRIFYMRNFNNWIKSQLMNEYLGRARDGLRHGASLRVMDMCCGKGGDLLKWRKANIAHLVCTDIAAVSLEQCEQRYREMCARARPSAPVFRAEFIAADCTRVQLRKKYKDPSMRLDLVSCQFAFHYSFESLAQAECMLRNAAECLRPGGYLIGTMPDANDIVARRRRAGKSSFGNNVYKITFLCEHEPAPPLFGAKYNFQLDGVVDCPEFLVHFPTLVKLARRHGLQLESVERFDAFFARVHRQNGAHLLHKMHSLETFPPLDAQPLLGTASNDYEHAKCYLASCDDPHARIGTLSRSEWEAVCEYCHCVRNVRRVLMFAVCSALPDVRLQESQDDVGRQRKPAVRVRFVAVVGE